MLGPTLIAILTAVPAAALGSIIAAMLVHKRLSPKSKAEARDITAAAIDKDWTRFQREIGRLVKRVEQAEGAAAKALAGQHACEQREIILNGKIVNLEAIIQSRGEIRQRAAQIAAADRMEEGRA